MSNLEKANYVESEGRMRNIADIVKDDREGKELSQTERQIAVAYIQGKYDAIKELKIYNNSNTNEVLNKVRVEIEMEEKWLLQAGYNTYNVDIAFSSIFSSIKSALEESEK